jgi:mannosyltransferase
VNRYLILLGAITLVAAAVRIFGLESESFWLDEARTAELTTLTFGELWSFDAEYITSNPPAYIVLMKAWVQISRSDFWFRAPSMIAGVLTIPLVYLIGARMGSRKAGLVAASLLALAGHHVRYSQEARAYAILTFLVAVVILSLTQLISEPDGRNAPRLWRSRHLDETSGIRNAWHLTWTDVAWLAYGLAVGAALHMHNTSVTILVAANAGVGVWWLRSQPRPPRFLRNWTLANLLGLLIWSTWLPGFFRQVVLVSERFLSSNNELSFENVVGNLAEQATAYVDFVLPLARAWWWDAAVLGAVAFLIWLGVRRLDIKYRPLIVSFIVIHPIVELIFSLRQPIFLPRSLLWLLVATVTAVGFAVSRLGRAQLVLAMAFLIALPALSTAAYHLDFKKPAWEEAADLVASEAGDDDIVLLIAPDSVVQFNRYFDRHELNIETIGVPWDIRNREAEGTFFSKSDLELVLDNVKPYDRVWLLLNRVNRVQNGTDLGPALREVSANTEVYELPRVTVMAFDD